MIAGFALVAWPTEWGDTGVMTFVVNQQGKVYQNYLGSKTEKIARAITILTLKTLGLRHCKSSNAHTPDSSHSMSVRRRLKF